MSNVKEIVGYYAFGRCTGLTEIDLSNVTKLGYFVFKDWTSDQKIKVPFASNNYRLPPGWNENWKNDCRAQIIYTNTNS